MPFSPEQLLNILHLLPSMLLSLTIHEFAHARTALAFGDPTAKANGRVTMNPLAHLDPIGTLCLVFAGFGWARPVPVNPLNLEPPRLGDIAVSIAGIASNLMLAVLCAGILRVLVAVNFDFYTSTGEKVWLILIGTFVINVALAVLNLIPLFPLDGHHLLRDILPDDQQYGFMRWQVHYGPLALMGLILGPRLLTSLLEGTALPAYLDPIGYVIGRAQLILGRWLGVYPETLPYA